MLVGRTVTELMKSGEERVRLDAAKYYTARRMGWKETNANEQVGKDGGPIETKDVSAIDIIRTRILTRLLVSEWRRTLVSRLSRARPLVERHGTGNASRICADRRPARARRERCEGSA